MSYVDCYFNRNKDTVYVVERVNGKRVYQEYQADYHLYYKDKSGKHKSLYGDKLSKIKTNSWKRFQKELRIYDGLSLFESDLKTEFVILEKYYLDAVAPDLHVCFFDIEVEFDPKTGFSPPDDPFMPINAISLYNQWDGELYTLVVKPDTISINEAERITQKFNNVVLCDNEKQLLECFLALINDVDLLTGWNSSSYDIPYIVNRIKQVLSIDDTRRLCLWDLQPVKKTFEQYGKEQTSYTLIGRVHLDYLQLYQKHTYSELHSYRLDAVGEYEVDERKVVYDGTFKDLYENEFEKFIEYNRQDTMIIAKLDDKLQFISLSNILAHENTIKLQTTLGAVALTDQAIINEYHSHNMAVNKRKAALDDINFVQFMKKEEMGDYEKWRENAITIKETIAGAYVADPKRGYHIWVGSADVNSLYPNAIIAWNISPETIVGQIRQTETQRYLFESMAEKKTTFADAWSGLFTSLEMGHVLNKDPAKIITIDFEDNTSVECTGAEAHKLIFQSDWCVSANGTIFRTDVEGIIPGLLRRWIKDRKLMQAKARKLESDGKEEEAKFWNQRQEIKKIQLNALYGALTNPGCRFFDQRMGQSITLNGRNIAKHMAAKVNELLTGEYDHTGEAIISGDTDSVYFSAYPVFKDSGVLDWTKENVTPLYDGVVSEMNKSFAKFVNKNFNVPLKRAKVLQAGREVCGTSAIFTRKKKYAINVYDFKGIRQDVDGKDGKLKIMGLETQRSDTPEYVQKFLKECLTKVLVEVDLTNLSEEIIAQLDTVDDDLDKKKIIVDEHIKDFRGIFHKRDAWTLGSPKRVNNLTAYTNKEKKSGRANMPGHVRAAMNWNKLRKINSDLISLEIIDGYKVVVCKLKPNPMGLTSVAYPVDELRLPEWFKKLPFNPEEMEILLIDQKLENLFGVLNWDFKDRNQTTFDDLFG